MVMLALLLCQTSGDIRDPETLGRFRAKFGERYPHPKAESEYHVSFYGMSFGSTRMLFPAGRADRRYYVTPGTGTLILQTKSKGKIKVVWIAKLGGLTKEPKTGTLERFLSDGNLEVQPPISQAVRESLKAVKPFALYYGDSVGHTFRYGLIGLDGDWKELTFHYEGPLPDTPFDYPITDEERKLIGRG